MASEKRYRQSAMMSEEQRYRPLDRIITIAITIIIVVRAPSPTVLKIIELQQGHTRSIGSVDCRSLARTRKGQTPGGEKVANFPHRREPADNKKKVKTGRREVGMSFLYSVHTRGEMRKKNTQRR